MDIVERLLVRNTPYGHLELFDKAAAEIKALRSAARSVVDDYPVASGRYIDSDGRDGYGSIRTLRLVLENPIR